MSIVEILMRSISGYIFIIPGIIFVFWGIKKICKKTNTTSYYNSIYILLLPNWYSDNDRYWQAESI